MSYPITQRIRDERRKEAEKRAALYAELSWDQKFLIAGEKQAARLLKQKPPIA